MEPLLKRKELIPNFTLPDASGAPVTRSIYRGKQHLILVFLPSLEDEIGRAYARALDSCFVPAQAAGGMILLVVRASIQEEVAQAQQDLVLPFPLLVDSAGTVTARFLPPGAQAGAFVSDRYGELYYSVAVQQLTDLPPVAELFSWLEAVDNQCTL